MPSGKFKWFFLVVAALAVLALIEHTYRELVLKPDVYGRLKSALHAEAQVSMLGKGGTIPVFYISEQMLRGICRTCFSPALLERVEKLYVHISDVDGGYYRIEKKCPPGTQCPSHPHLDGAVLVPAPRESVEASMTLGRASGECQRGVVGAVYSYEICHNNLVAGDVRYGDYYSVDLDYPYTSIGRILSGIPREIVALVRIDWVFDYCVFEGRTAAVDADFGRICGRIQE